MIDPALSLAMSMHANPGVFALLLGSGVSRSAGILTGWDIVIDLVRKLVAMQGQDCGADPEAWYTTQYGQKPAYSLLLDAIAKSQAERSKLLLTYFQPTEEEREQGLKVPTRAHKAIARLIQQGHVRVVLTTNFDRLMEQALSDISIDPTVISSPDGADGAVPLMHSRCTIIKLHGDYLDLRSKNTPDELDSYDPRQDGLLDRVLDEFGLIVCGWSAEWDTALRKSIERCKTRRFSTYWTVRGPLGSHAQRLIQQRDAQTIQIADADSFFSDLAEKVEALKNIDRQHPISVQVAVAQTKKYLSEPKHTIAFHDLLTQETERVVAEVNSVKYSLAPPGDTDFAKEAVNRIRAFEAVSEVLLRTFITACYWGKEQHHPVLVRCLERLGNPPQRLGVSVQSLNDLRAYPAALLLYGGGLAALAARRYDILRAIWTQPMVRDRAYIQPIVAGLFESFHWHDVLNLMLVRESYVPLSVHLEEFLREPLREFLPSDEQYQEHFDQFEHLQALVSSDVAGGIFYYGLFPYRRERRVSQNRPEQWVVTRVRAEFQKVGEKWPPLAAGLFGGSLTKAEQAFARLNESLGKIGY